MLLIALLMMAPATEQCGLCHPGVRVQHQDSVHAREMVKCVDCHGGDPAAISVAGAHRGNFRRSLSRRQIPRLCSSCHADPEKMRPYNLPTDQLALYQTSQHGRQLARGDNRVAVCTDCHGTHDILEPQNPLSRVNHLNVPETCGRCHADLTLMARYGIDQDVVQDYLEGVHGRELLQRGNQNAPECSRCHGVHGASPPGIGDVEKVCGLCHQAAREAFRSGPHGVMMAEAGLPECVACHQPHAGQTAPRTNIVEVCRRCHDDASPEAEIGLKMDVLFARAHEEVSKAEERIQEVAAIPLYVEDYEARLREAQTYLLEAEPAVHSVSLEETERLTRAARVLGEEIEAEIQGELSDLRIRKVGLIVFWFYLLLTVAILLRFRRSAREG